MVQSLVEKSRQLSIPSTCGGLSVTCQDRYKLDMRPSPLYICNCVKSCNLIHTHIAR